MEKSLRDYAPDEMVRRPVDSAIVDMCREGWIGQMTTFDFTRAPYTKKGWGQRCRCMAQVAVCAIQVYYKLIDERKGNDDE